MDKFQSILSHVYTYISEYGLSVIGALLIFFIGRKIAKILVNVCDKIMQKSKVDETLKKFLLDAIYILLTIFILLAALSKLGVETTSFIAILGAASLAVGLAFKDTFSNVGAGVMLILFRPFKAGDFVEVGGTSGNVESINMFSVRLNSVDNKLIIVPNSQVLGKNIINYSAKDTRRVDFVFGIGYEDDLRLAKQVLKDIVAQEQRALKSPESLVAVSELADSSVNFVVRIWVKSADYWGVYFDTIEKVKLTFDEKGISIPYPQMDVHQK